MSMNAPRAPLTLASEQGRRGPITLDLYQALTLAVLIHLVGIWLMLQLPPERSRPLPTRAPIVVELEPPRGRARVPRPFKFVDIPDEPQVRNPQANSLSDRSRRARGPLSSPQARRPENEDPYALGNALDRVMHAPAQNPAAPRGAGGTGPAPVASASTGVSPGPPAPSPPAAVAASTERQPAAPRQGPSSPRQGAAERPARPAGTGGTGDGRAPGNLLDSVPQVSEADLLESFHNPGGASPMDIGTVSFDTAAIDWGPYAREMLKIIRHNWIERMPPAALSGLRGVAVMQFRIARDGSVSGVTLVDSYGVRRSPAGALEVTPGIRPLEATAQSAIEVSELPPLPGIFTEPDVGVTIGFFYNLRPPRP